jgi:hypothetical protein
MKINKSDQSPKIMSDAELIEIALYKILDRNVENLQTNIRTWVKSETLGEFPDEQTYCERLRKLTDDLRSICDEIDQYAQKLDDNISKQAGGK